MRGRATSGLADRVNTDKNKIVNQSCETVFQVKADEQIMQMSRCDQKYNP